jgi:hypothetical protein
MGYGDNRYGGDNRHGSDRPSRPEGGRWDRERSSYGSWGSERDRDRSSERHRSGGDDDRGFIDRAGDEVRSWFGDDDAQRRREMDERRWEREQRMSGDRSNDYRGSTSFGGGFGNQRGWGDDHFDRQRERSDRDGGDHARYAERGGSGGGGGGADTWGGSGFGGPDDNGRRFDRVDAGHVGSQGAHPMSAPVGGGYAAGGAGGSSARSAAILRNSGQGRQGGSHSGSYGGGVHDPHYHEHRQRQIDELDRDYEEYRREHQSRFEQEFGGWREKRQTQRKHMTRAAEQMEVVGSDGEHVGTVDKVRGDRIILTKSDPNADGIHHSIPCSWIENVDEKVTINKTAKEAIAAWRDEDHNRALFEREDQGQGGPHVLNRSFSGTYKDE